jgi:hypothetical protein
MNFEEDEEEDGEDSEDEEGSDDDEDAAEEENTAEEEQEKNHPATTKPVDVARAPSPASRRQPAPRFRRQSGADKNAIVVELDENALARHLLEVFDFGSSPGAK